VLRWLYILLIVACSRAPAESPPAHRAFYYWRTTVQLSAAEQRALTDLQVDRLYMRMFDVEWNDAQGGTEVVGKITGRAPAIEIVPVVFVRDEVFHHVDAKHAAELAQTTWAEVARRAELLGFTPHELQIDCDWTETSREAFFEFLKRLHAVAKLDLSATIRLHQIKYRERTGVPPVQRGMLMFYNMGKFSADPEARAIFDAASAQRYLARVGEYPLPLDAALPIWSWVVHLRDDRVEGLLQSTDPDELPDLPFLARAAPDRFVATRTAFLHGTLLREGDVLKVELIGPADVMTAATMLAPNLAGVSVARTISLFDLSERNVTRHGTTQLDKVFRAIR
jgi:hypothetical protein